MIMAREYLRVGAAKRMEGVMRFVDGDIFKTYSSQCVFVKGNSVVDRKDVSQPKD